MPKPYENLSGKRFGRLTAKERVIRNRKAYWICDCDCGGVTEVTACNLKSAQIKSCGCLKKEHAWSKYGKRKYIQNPYKPDYKKIYVRWQCIKRRCYDSKFSSYRHYGGRGIRMCKEWRDNFQNFYDWIVRSGYKDGLTVDRINNDGDYCPENCRLTDYYTQSRNKRSNINITFCGQTHCLKDWAEILGISYKTISVRYYRKWPTEKLLKELYDVDKSTRTGWGCVDDSQ